MSQNQEFLILLILIMSSGLGMIVTVVPALFRRIVRIVWSLCLDLKIQKVKADNKDSIFMVLCVN